MFGLTEGLPGAPINAEAQTRMAFESIARVKEMTERLQSRIGTIKKHAEESARVAFAAVEINGAAAAWGYFNERFGKAADSDPNGLKEIMVAGIPADLGVGVGLLAASFLGALGAYAEHGTNLGNGSTAAFAFRFGHEFAKKHAKTATTTKGAPPQFAAGYHQPYYGAHGGHVHHVPYGGHR
jgi:hypothetical protein